jgi:hypothetical protein
MKTLLVTLAAAVLFSLQIQAQIEEWLPHYFCHHPPYTVDILPYFTPADPIEPRHVLIITYPNLTSIYDVYVSTNLRTWKRVGSNKNFDGSTLHIYDFDVNLNKKQKRYYKVVLRLHLD